MQRVVIIDYGSGNLHSARKAVQRAANDGGIDVVVEVTADAGKVASADRIVLPGVGAFADCKAGLAAVPGMIEALNEAVIEKGRAFFGICVGMQLMAMRGHEFGETPGLGWIDGDVSAIAPTNATLKIPHMGWNTLNKCCDHSLLKGITLGPDGLHAYFVHSFHMQPKNRSLVCAEADYGGTVTAMVCHDNMAGTQFHPEKSQRLGLQLLENFLRWAP